MLTLNAAKRAVIEALKAGNIETPALDTRILLREATGLSGADLIAASDEAIRPETYEHLQALVQRRLSGEPISAILGRREFWKDEFIVTGNVLTPRPETEGIIEAALSLPITPTDILDLGTGSGALLLSLLREFPKAFGTGIDISDPALDVARSNAKRLGIAARFLKGSWLSGVDESFDLIVSNPPYITSKQMESLEPAVLSYDPDLSLWGGEDGLDPYREILAAITPGGPLILGGHLIFEVGQGQASTVASMMTLSGFQAVVIKRDLSGIERIIHGQFTHGKKA